jgi:hypothetical protein
MEGKEDKTGGTNLNENVFVCFLFNDPVFRCCQHRPQLLVPLKQTNYMGGNGGRIILPNLHQLFQAIEVSFMCKLGILAGIASEHKRVEHHTPRRSAISPSAATSGLRFLFSERQRREKVEEEERASPSASAQLVSDFEKPSATWMSGVCRMKHLGKDLPKQVERQDNTGPCLACVHALQ